MHTAVILIVSPDAPARRNLRLQIGNIGHDGHEFDSLETLLASPLLASAECVLVDIAAANATIASLQAIFPHEDDRPAELVFATRERISEGLRLARRHGLSVHELIEVPAEDGDLQSALNNALQNKLRKMADDRVNPGSSVLARLSDREREVLKRMVNGESNRKIGEALGISYRTVEVYRSRIQLKTGLRGLPNLVQFVVATGMD